MKKNRTRRELFLAEMDAVVPWGRLLGLIERHYPKAGPKGGRPPMPLQMILRIYFLQNWYALSDPMAEEMPYDSEAMRHFAGIELGDDRIPPFGDCFAFTCRAVYETTILNFRHLLERHGLTEAIFAEVNAQLADKGSRNIVRMSCTVMRLACFRLGIFSPGPIKTGRMPRRSRR